MGRRRTHEPRSEFGQLLAAQLAHLGLGPAEFAKRSGLSLSHVYQLLRGDRSDPRGTTLRKASAALGLTDAQLGRGLTADPGGVNGAQALDFVAADQVDKAAFFAIMSAFPSGVAIVTTLDERGQPKGLTCTAVCSLSADPPLLLVCVDKKSNTLPALRHSRQFVVNYLLAGRGELSNRFATRAPDKWANLAWRPTRAGMPWLHQDCVAHAECTSVREMDGGDHVIIVGRVHGGQPPAPGTQPLMYFRRTYAAWPE